MQSILDGTSNEAAPRRAMVKRLTMKRLTSFTRASPIHENGRRRNVSYRNCIFLGETGTFLALDDQGTADIIRPSPSSRNEKNCKQHQDDITTPAIVESFQAVESAEACLRQRCGLFSLRDGKAFAIALHDGKLKLYDTETTSSFPFANEPASFGLEQADPGRIGLCFSLQGWIARCPLRVNNERQSSTLSLRQQLDPRKQTALMSQSLEDGPLVGGGINWTAISHTVSHQVGWDVRESPALNAVHVSQFRDTFSMRFFDERTDKHHTIVNLDADSDRLLLRDVCYRSDYSVATATDTSVMLWDVRMLRKNTKLARLCVFPDDFVHAMNPSIMCKEILDATKAPSIHRLQCLASGDLLVLTQSDYCVIDPIRNKLKSRSSKGIFDESHLTAVDTNFGILAKYDPDGPWKNHCFHQSIHLFDVYETKKSRKRKHDGSNTILTSIIDNETETMTSLRSLSFNSRGDSLVGSSVDGNVFVFN